MSLAKIVPVKAGEDPRAVAVGEGSIWIANAGDGTVSRINPVTNRANTIKVGVEPDAIGVGEGGVWVVNRLSRSVSRIDPGTDQVVTTIPLDVTGVPSSIAVGEGAVWIGVEADSPLGTHSAALHKIDPGSNRDVATIELKGTPSWLVLTTGDGAVWVAADDGELYRLDPRTNDARTLARLGTGVVGITMADGSLWIATTLSQVLRVDPTSGRIEATVPGGSLRPGALVGSHSSYLLGISAFEGIVWVTGKQSGTIDRITTNGNTALPPIEIGKTPTGVAAGFGSVWVTVDAAA